VIGNLKRFSIYIAVFILLLTLVSFTNFWRVIDYYLFQQLHSKEIELDEEIVLIDLPYRADGKSFNIDSYRNRTGDLLRTIESRVAVGESPKAVILDMYFSSDDNSLDSIKTAINSIKDKTKLFVVFNALGAHQKGLKDREEEHAMTIYDLLGKPYLHTIIEPKMLGSFFNTKIEVLSYWSEIEISVDGESGSVSEFIEALPLKVARDLNPSIIKKPFEPVQYVLPIGNPDNIKEHTYAFNHAENAITGGAFLPELNLKDKIIVVGSLEHDKVDFLSQASPYLVAWAIDDQLNKNENVRTPFDNVWVILGQILFFSLFTALVFANFFKYLKSLQTKPLLLAGLSSLCGLLLLAAVAMAVLATGHIMLVGLTTVAIFLTALLSWRYSLKFLVTGIIEGSGKYDVFISYSRADSEWVIKNVYEPLKNLRTAKGEPLSIFFDRESIGIGEAFTAKYMWAIVDSQFFIPVFSESYYGKNHCKNEMDLAYKRSVEKLIKLIPIAHSYNVVPQIYTHVNFANVEIDPDFFNGIKKAILDES